MKTAATAPAKARSIPMPIPHAIPDNRIHGPGRPEHADGDQDRDLHGNHEVVFGAVDKGVVGIDFFDDCHKNEANDDAKQDEVG
jgi:hypothetical protein